MNQMYQTKKRLWKIRLSSMAVLIIVVISVLYVARIWIRNLDGKTEITLHQSAIRENPYSALMRTDLGQVYLKYNMPDLAIATFQSAIAIRKDDPINYFSMANAYMNIGRDDKAIQALEEALRIDPKYPEAYYNLAGTYAKAGSTAKADEYLKKAVYYFNEQGRHEEAQSYENAFKAFFKMVN